MLKLQSKDPGKSFWLVDPVMRVGAANDNEISISGEGVHDLHAKIITENEALFIEPISGAQTFLNEQLVSFKTSLDVGALLRFGVHEFAVVDPSQKTANPFNQSTEAKQPVSNDATLFRPKAASSNGSGWFIQAMHKSLQNKRYPIDGVMSLGRSKDCDLSFSFDRLSRKHAQFELLDDVLFVKDLQSSNGVFHNGQKVPQAKLAHGDTVAFDKLEFTVVNTAQSNSAPTASQDSLNETLMGHAPASKAASPSAANVKSTPKTKSATAKPDKSSGMVPLVVVGVSLVVVAGLAAFFLL